MVVLVKLDQPEVFDECEEVIVFRREEFASYFKSMMKKH